MTAAPLLSRAVQVRTAEPGDAAALLALHREGFGSGWQERHWQWRFVDNPLRRTEIVGAFAPEGRCLASFCGVPLPCRYAGEPALVVSAGDVIVHPRLRTSVAGALLLLRVSTQFFETFGGGAVRVVFGFPQPALLRFMVRHCRIEVLGDVAVLVRGASHGAAPGSDLRVGVDCRLPADVEALAARWQSDVGTGIVRDGRYLQWRYVDNPHADYTIVTVRRPTGTLLGLAVLRLVGPNEDTALLVEWLVPRTDAVAAGALLAAAERLAVAAGRPNLAVSFAPSSPEYASFRAVHGFRVVQPEHRLVFRTYSRGIDHRFLTQQWFHSLGDMDCT